jgi:L-aminopeptidase/D-esterase-like protein
MNHTLTSIHGVKVGHAEDRRRLSGCTVLLFQRPAVTACDPRGGWPGGYDTGSVEAGKTFYMKQAILLTGGDIFGFDAAAGIRRFLLEHKLASTEVGKVPGIVGTNIYDIGFSKDVTSINYEQLGYMACKNASSSPVTQGNVGAGIGATVGKFRSMNTCWKGGLGSSVQRINEEIMVGAVVVTNAVGNVFDPSDGRTIAGTRRRQTNAADFCELTEVIPEYLSTTRNKKRTRATSIGVIVTNAQMTHEQVIRVAQAGHDGLARVIRPVHATTDGDTMFAVSTNEIKKTYDSTRMVTLISEVAAQEVSNSVLNAVRNALPLNGVPGLKK